MAINSLYFLGLTSAIALLFIHRSALQWQVAAAAFITVFLANQIRASYRKRVVLRTLGKETHDKLKPTFTLERWATPIWFGINLLLLLRASFGTIITWRNIRYRINAPQDIQRLEA